MFRSAHVINRVYNSQVPRGRPSLVDDHTNVILRVVIKEGFSWSLSPELRTKCVTGSERRLDFTECFTLEVEQKMRERRHHAGFAARLLDG